MFGMNTDIELLAGEVEHDLELPREPDRQVLRDGLESIPTGPYLAAIVLATDVTRLNGHDAVRYLKASARMESRFAAQRLAATAEVAYSPASGPNTDVVRKPLRPKAENRRRPTRHRPNQGRRIPGPSKDRKSVV